MTADVMTPEQRSRCMRQIKSKDTSLELVVRSGLHRMGLRFRKHYARIPGSPDVAFPRARLAVFLDGDFWHGRMFRAWKGKLPDFWLRKITRNRARDASNRLEIRRMGWSFIRLWEHDVKEDLPGSLSRIADAVLKASSLAGVPPPAAALPARHVPQLSWRESAKAISRALGKQPRKAAARAGAKARDRAEDAKKPAVASKSVAFRTGRKTAHGTRENGKPEPGNSAAAGPPMTDTREDNDKEPPVTSVHGKQVTRRKSPPVQAGKASPEKCG